METIVNTYRKGNRAELEARMMCEAEGALIWKPSRAKFQNNDIFGLFDFIAIYPTGNLRLVQVKSSISNFYEARQFIRQFVLTYSIKPPIFCEVWLRKGPKNYKIHREGA